MSKVFLAMSDVFLAMFGVFLVFLARCCLIYAVNRSIKIVKTFGRWQKIHNSNKISPRDPYKSIEHKKSTFWAKSELPNPSGHPKKAPNTFPTLTHHTRTSPEPLPNHAQSYKIIQIEGFEPWDPSHEKERTKICRKLKSRASETVWASSYGRITVLKPKHVRF